jgi:hypothetical protein
LERAELGTGQERKSSDPEGFGSIQTQYRINKEKEVKRPNAQITSRVTPEEVQEIAEKAYLYGLQQVIYTGQRWIYTQNDVQGNIAFSGLNRFFWVRKKITPDFPMVTPNATTLYGSGFLDLRREPVVIEMPEITDRYFSLQLMDQYGIFHTIVGSPFNGTKSRKYLFVPPGYDGKLPGSFPTTDIISWPTKTALVGVRIAVETGTDDEIAMINAYQDQITATLLSDWTANGSAGVPQSDRKIVKGDFEVYPRMPEIAFAQVEKQTAQDFYTILNMVLNDPSMTLMKDSFSEAEMLDQLQSIGIGRGLAFDWESLPADTKAATEAGFKAGFDGVRKALKTGLIDMNGWMEARMSGDFETNWLDRAVMADAGYGGPDKDISHAAAYRFTDADGKPLNGSNNYTITFDMNDLPPVTEFWSIPIYNAEGYFVANEIERYTINSFMLERGDLVVKDGKLVIYVQNKKPNDPDMAKNWLPAPPEGFRFTARFYGPYESIVSGSYDMPAPVNTGPAN